VGGPSVAGHAPHVPPDLALSIDRALARDPDARWASAREFARALVGYAPAQFGATTRRDQSPARTSSSSDSNETDPLDAASALSGSVSRAASTPRTDHDDPQKTQPHPLLAPEPAGASGAGAGSGSGSGSKPGSGVRAGSVPPGGRTQRSGPPPRRSSRPPRRGPERGEAEPRRRSSGGAWFVGGALVGAILAALGAAFALWAGSSRATDAGVPPAAAADANAPRPIPEAR
jgi:hypothetical protein